MLVLTRKPGESVTLRTEHGEEITVHLIGKGRGRHGFHIGFDAPRSTKILRRELAKDNGKHNQSFNLSNYHWLAVEEALNSQVTGVFHGMESR